MSQMHAWLCSMPYNSVPNSQVTYLSKRDRKFIKKNSQVTYSDAINSAPDEYYKKKTQPRMNKKLQNIHLDKKE